MHNFIFDYYGEKYITTYGTGYYIGCVPLTDLPESIAPQLVPSLTNPIYVTDSESWKDAWFDIHVKGTVVIEGERYLLDTSNKKEPLIKESDIPRAETKAEVVKAPVQEVVVVRAKSNPPQEKVEQKEPDAIAVKVEPEPVPEPIVPIIEKEAVVVPKQEIEISKDIPKGLPNAVFDLVEEWTNKSPDKDRLAEDGDAYCIENDWHYAAGYYIIDDVKGMVRYIHSDVHTVDITLTIAEVQVIRNNGYRY